MGEKNIGNIEDLIKSYTISNEKISIEELSYVSLFYQTGF